MFPWLAMISIQYISSGSDDNTGGNLVMKTTNAGGNWNKVFLTTTNQNIRTGWSGAEATEAGVMVKVVWYHCCTQQRQQSFIR